MKHEDAECCSHAAIYFYFLFFFVLNFLYFFFQAIMKREDAEQQGYPDSLGASIYDMHLFMTCIYL